MTFESEGLLIVAIYIWLPPASYVVFQTTLVRLPWLPRDSETTRLPRCYNYCVLFLGYHAIATRHDRPDEEEDIVEEDTSQVKAFQMPELMHNLNILVDMAEEDIIQNDRK